MQPALYVGTVRHSRQIPKRHDFQYSFFMWFLNLDELDRLPALGRWFSTSKAALSRYNRPDYHGDPQIPLADAIRDRMQELTGQAVAGQVCGLMNMRTLGLYFSPVNFYYGYDKQQQLTHFLAEVSNTPWNERHQYCHLVKENKLNPENEKEFHVSPFNPSSQHYQWKLIAPGKDVLVQIEVDDARGHIFTARLELQRRPLSLKNIRKELLKKPIMTIYIVAGIYWQALKLFSKGVPYVPYNKEAI